MGLRHSRTPSLTQSLTRSPRSTHVESVTSHVRGDTTAALIEDTIGAVFDRAVAAWPDTEALVSVEQRIRWTYREFGERVDQLAAGLLALGLEPGDRVGIWAPNCAEWVMTQFATAKVGL